MTIRRQFSNIESMRQHPGCERSLVPKASPWLSALHCEKSRRARKLMWCNAHRGHCFWVWFIKSPLLTDEFYVCVGKCASTVHAVKSYRHGASKPGYIKHVPSSVHSSSSIHITWPFRPFQCVVCATLKDVRKYEAKRVHDWVCVDDRHFHVLLNNILYWFFSFLSESSVDSMKIGEILEEQRLELEGDEFHDFFLDRSDTHSEKAERNGWGRWGGGEKGEGGERERENWLCDKKLSGIPVSAPSLQIPPICM